MKNKTLKKGERTMRNKKNAKIITKKMTLDERELVALEIFKLFERCNQQGIESDYSAYLAFCTIGGIMYKHTPDLFEECVVEIINKAS